MPEFCTPAAEIITTPRVGFCQTHKPFLLPDDDNYHSHGRHCRCQVRLPILRSPQRGHQARQLGRNKGSSASTPPPQTEPLRSLSTAQEVLCGDELLHGVATADAQRHRYCADDFHALRSWSLLRFDPTPSQGFYFLRDDPP